MFLLQSNRYRGNLFKRPPNLRVLGWSITRISTVGAFRIFTTDSEVRRTPILIVYGIAVAVILLRMFGLPQGSTSVSFDTYHALGGL